MLRYLTAGESHGKCMIVILDGIPAGLRLTEGMIALELKRRMKGFGRGKRMSFEKDRPEVLSGLRRSVTIGSPVAITIRNVDHSINALGVIVEPRPGHADLAGAMKYGHRDIRNVLERASARETASRVAAGAVAKALLGEFGIKVMSHVVMIGDVEADSGGMLLKDIARIAECSSLRCVDKVAEKLMREAIEEAAREGDTLGGVFEVIAHGIPAGLGSYTQWDRRLSARLAEAVMSIQAVKGVGFGAGFSAARTRGSSLHDEIFYDRDKGFYRKTNAAGGIEGGVSNGEDIVIRAAMKPIATLRRPLASVNIRSKKAVKGSVQRADICAVPSAGVVGEAVVALEIANAFIEKFGGDSITEMKRNYNGYMAQARKF